MSAIIIKAKRSTEVTSNPSLALWQRVSQALKELSGLMLSDLTADATAAVEAQLVAINQITSAYDIEVDADYEKLTEGDADQILDRVTTITHLCVDSETERVMKALATADRKLPVAAIKEVREHQDIFLPLLMQALEQAVTAVRNGEETEGDAHFFAVCLLTELESDDAFPSLLDAFRLPDDGAYELLGDAVHELVAPALALFSRGDTETICEVVQDSDVDRYVRWSAARAYKHLVRDGLISRSDAAQKLHQHFQHYVESGEHDLLAPLACELGDLAAEEALGTIRSAYVRDLVDESIVHLEFIESQIAAGEETVKRAFKDCRPTGMPDTIAELSRWAAFQEEPPRPPKKPTTQSAHVPRPHLSFSDSDRPQPVTTVRADRKVGRNDPCPCGSGKKFKNCCR